MTVATATLLWLNCGHCRPRSDAALGADWGMIHALPTLARCRCAHDSVPDRRGCSRMGRYEISRLEGPVAAHRARRPDPLRPEQARGPRTAGPAHAGVSGSFRGRA